MSRSATSRQHLTAVGVWLSLATGPFAAAAPARDPAGTPSSPPSVLHAAPSADEDADLPPTDGERTTDPSPATDASPAETQAAAAEKAAQDAEAEVIELRREIENLERERAGYDDLRRRVDELEARGLEAERQAGGAPDLSGAAASPLRFHDLGLEIRSADNGFLLRPHARVQVVYTGELAAAGAQDLANPDVSSFSVARAEVILEGHVGGPSFQYRIQLEAVGPARVRDAYLAWRPTRLITIEAGQLKVPFGLQRQYWTAELEFVDFSTATAAFSLERDVGLLLVDQLIPGRLTLQVAVVNGSGADVPNDNLDLAYALRVVASPFGAMPTSEGDIEGHVRPRLSIGVAGYYSLVPTDVRLRQNDPMAPIDLDGDGRPDNVGVWQGAAELRAVWRGAALEAEAFRRFESLGVAGPSRDTWGGYVQASAFLLPHRLQVAGRIGRTDLPLYGATAEEHLLLGSRVDEQAAAINAYLRGHLIKVQVDYTHLTSPDAQTAPSAHRVRAAVQIGF